MPRRRISKNVLSKNFTSKRLSIDELPGTTIQVTMRALRWIFLLIFLYISISIFFLLLQGGNEEIANIVVYSVSGFFTFFMGYFGWMFARNVLEIVSGKKPEEKF